MILSFSASNVVESFMSVTVVDTNSTLILPGRQQFAPLSEEKSIRRMRGYAKVIEKVYKMFNGKIWLNVKKDWHVHSKVPIVKAS